MTELITALNGLSWPAALVLGVGLICAVVAFDAVLTTIRSGG